MNKKDALLIDLAAAMLALFFVAVLAQLLS